MATLTITDIELAINYWREKGAPSDEITLNTVAFLLVTVYGEMIYRQTHLIDTASLPQSVRESIDTALNSSA